MGPIPGLDHHAQLGSLGRKIRENALVHNLDDVCARISDGRGQLRELPWSVGEIDIHLRQPPATRKLARVGQRRELAMTPGGNGQ